VIIAATACGAVLAVGLPADASTKEPAAALTASTTTTSISTTMAQSVSTAVNSADEYPDYRPDPIETSTDRAKALGAAAEASLAGTGFGLTEAVEFTPPDATDPVIQISLHPTSGGSRAQVIIWIFKDTRKLEDTSTASRAESEIPGYGAHDVTMAGVSRAYYLTGPRGSYAQLVAQLADGMTINICSESGELKADTLPLDRTGMEKVLSLLVKTL
jgi:hypothetical protein